MIKLKILVSDYDNTFHVKDCDMNENIEKVEQFRKNNLFVIATGRSYESYETQKKLFNIKTDYLVINHGATILKDDIIIYNKSIDNNIKNELIQDLELDNAESVYCYRKKELVDITEEDITKILINYKDNETAVKIRKMIKNKYFNRLRNFHFNTYNSVEIVSAEVDKSMAIGIISRLEKLDEIYVIGDNYNDYLMIKNYGGSCTHVAIDEVKQIAVKEYENVSNFIDEIMGVK